MTSLTLACGLVDARRYWKSIAQIHAVVGKQVHDARLVAVCRVHGVGHLLTFNVSHFARYAATIPDIVVVAPQAV